MDAITRIIFIVLFVSMGACSHDSNNSGIGGTGDSSGQGQAVLGPAVNTPIENFNTDKFEETSVPEEDNLQIIRNAIEPIKSKILFLNTFNHVLEVQGALGVIYTRTTLQVGKNLLTLADLTDSTSPKITATIDLMKLISNTSELSQHFIGTYQPDLEIGDVKILSTQLFISVKAKGILVFDISDPQHPVYQELIPTYVTAMAERDDRLFYTSLEINPVTLVSYEECQQYLSGTLPPDRAAIIDSNNFVKRCKFREPDYDLTLTMRDKAGISTQLIVKKIGEPPLGRLNSIDLDVFEGSVLINIGRDPFGGDQRDELIAVIAGDNTLIQGSSWLTPMFSKIGLIQQLDGIVYVDIEPNYSMRNVSVLGDAALVLLDSSTLQEIEKIDPLTLTSLDIKNYQIIKIDSLPAEYSERMQFLSNYDQQNILFQIGNKYIESTYTDSKVISPVDMELFGGDLVLIDEQGIIIVYDPVARRQKSSIKLPDLLSAEILSIINNNLYIVTSQGVVIMDTEVLQ